MCNLVWIIIKVHITEDSDGYIMLKGSPPLDYSRGQAAGASPPQPKMRLKRCGSIEIESKGKPGDDHYFQDERGKEEVNPWALKCHRDNLKKVGIHLTSAPALPTCQQYILLENLTTGHKHPCVLDLKVGTRQHGDSASASKKLSKTTKVLNSTSGTLGLRLGGMQVYQVNLGRYICRTKNYGRSLSVEGLRSSLRQFFGNGLTLRMDVIRALLRKLAQLRSLLAGLDSYRFYTSSLLITYDGSEIKDNGLSGKKRSLSCDHLSISEPNVDPTDSQCVDVRLIDFAHSTHRGLQDPQDSYRHEGPDRGFLFGLENFMDILADLLKPKQAQDSQNVLCLQ